MTASAGAALIERAFRSYFEQFRALTRLAARHFEVRDIHGMQRDSVRRLDLYNSVIAVALDELGELFGAALADRPTWRALRTDFAARVASSPNPELAETFFNSIVRRVFTTVGVDPEIEFVAPATPLPPFTPPWTFTVTTQRRGGIEPTVRASLLSCPLAASWTDLEGDSARIAAALGEHAPTEKVTSIELVGTPFFRGKGAYLVGQAHLVTGATVPMVLALRNPGDGVVVDAALFTENEVSIVFSFARSYFFVDVVQPREMVDYLRTIMPRKPVAELWNALGFNRHGKTELYRSLLRYLDETDQRFTPAPGQRGMVMAVFTLEGFDVVFKVMRDRFEYPKTVTHEEVREKYRMVFRHDRAGRLVDAQEFEHLEFAVERFAPEVLRELTTSCRETVSTHDGRVVIRHLYTERRLRPLDLYLKEAEPQAAIEAVLDYGHALRDLAAANIFPGDMLLKNFGVSRHGRLIFYDYDELCRVTDCRFRDLPPARTDDEETSGEPWYFVGERDIFPEEFRSFLGLKGALLEAFLSIHGELLTADFWRHVQDLLERGQVLDIYPYRAARRLRRTPRTSGRDRRMAGSNEEKAT